MPLICTLSIEENEILSSLANRICRVTGVPFSEFIGNAVLYDLTALRDFPIASSRLKSRLNFQFLNTAEFLANNCSSMYFGVTLPQPFRSVEVRSSFEKAGTLLRLSLANSWNHLRFCKHCALAEYNLHRYSWWHRDHQLPLTSICMKHGSYLTVTELTMLGAALPHELCRTDMDSGRGVPRSWDTSLAKFEHCIATEGNQSDLHRKFDGAMKILTENVKDRFDVQELACERMSNVLDRLNEAGINEPRKDWDRLKLALCKLIYNGFEYGDPAVIILFVAAMSYPALSEEDFL